MHNDSLDALLQILFQIMQTKDASQILRLNMAFYQNKAGVCLRSLSAKEISEAILKIDSDYEGYSQSSYQLYNSIDMVDLVNSIVSDEG